MSPAQYATGVALLVLFTAPLAAGAWAARRVLVPHCQGAPARLAEAVLALGALLTIAELLGAAGQLRRAPLAVACVVVGAAVVVLCRAPTPLRPQTRKERSGRPRFDLATVLALAMAAAVTAQWWARSLSALDGGITEIDSRQYHLTFAGFFAQTGSTVSQHVAWLDPVWSYYPAHAEVVHAVGMVAFGHDVLSPVINLGWLAMAFLAAWCVGLRWGVAPGTLAAMALLAGTPLMATLESGTATNDIAALALLLSAVAFLVVEELTPGSLGLAGGAAGLALVPS